jgi:hypothetical protein
LWRTEWARIETIAAAYADLLGMQDDGVVGGVEAIDGTDRGAWRIMTMHARHGHGTLTWFAVVDRHDPTAIDPPRDFVLVLASGDARVALYAAIRVTEEFHTRHGVILVTLP